MLPKLSLIICLIGGVQNVICNKTCKRLQYELANEQSHFVSCATRNSVPVGLCTNCTIEYNNTAYIFQEIHLHCVDLFHQDRLNIIDTVQEAVTGLWSKAFCDDCYIRNHSKEFDTRNNKFIKCLIDNKNDICHGCSEQYKELNNYYVKLDQENNGKVCFDLQDQMNRTRHQWSNEWHCCQREQHLTIFIMIACIVLSIVATFYCGTYSITKYQERNHGILSDEEPSTTTLRINSTGTPPSSALLPIGTQSLPSNVLSSQTKKSELSTEEDSSTDEDNIADDRKLQM